MKHQITILALSTVAFALLSGCITFEPTVDTTKFYILNSHTQAQPLSEGKSVLVRNVSLADYLDNSQIAQRASSHTIDYLAQHRWAGSLEEMVADVIADEINANHPGYKAAILERGREELILDVRVLRFDFHPELGVSLQLEYNVMEADAGESLRQERISLQQSMAADAAVGAIVNSMEVVLRNAVNQMKLK